MASTCKVLSVDGDFFVSVQVAAGAQEVAIFGAASETFSKWVSTIELSYQAHIRYLVHTAY